jgi:DNA-binding transcriptional regulator YiaG
MAYTHRTKVGRYTAVDDGCCGFARTMQDGTPILSAEGLSKLERRAVITVLRDVQLVGGPELKFARKALGLRQTELAEHLGVAAETVSRWETGAEPFKRPVQLAVCELVETVERSGSLPRRRPSGEREVRVAELSGTLIPTQPTTPITRSPRNSWGSVLNKSRWGRNVSS